MSLNKFKSSKRNSLCRRLNVDIWGNFKYSRATNSRGFRKLYRRRRRDFRPNTFMFRLDKNKPDKPRKNYSMYGLGMLAKQNVKYFFGNIPESHFRRFFAQIRRYKGDRVFNITRNIESRLLMIIMRSGLFRTPYQIKQLILHGHVFVNSLKIKNYYFKLNPGDIVHFSPLVKSLLRKKFIRKNIKRRMVRPAANHLLISYRVFAIMLNNNPLPTSSRMPFKLDLFKLFSFYKT